MSETNIELASRTAAVCIKFMKGTFEPGKILGYAYAYATLPIAASIAIPLADLPLVI